MNTPNNYICFFDSHKSWGGGEKWHHETATYFHEQGFKTLVCANKNGVLSHLSKGIPQHEVQLSNLSFLNPFAYIRIYRILKKYEISTIILCLPIDIKVAGIVAKLLKIPNIVYRRGCAIPIKDSFSNRFLFSKVLTEIVANSQATKQSIVANNPNLIADEKIKVFYNGIPIPKSISHADNKIFTIGTAGRLEPQKNMFAVLEIAEILRKKNFSFCIKIAGEGGQYEQLKQEICKRSLQEYVQLLGFVENMNGFYNTIDAFILTSHGEGFGYVLAEAMAHELPILAFDTCSSPELISDNVNGFLIPLHDNQAFADKIEGLILDTQKAHTIGCNGRKIVEDKFEKEYNMSLLATHISCISK